MSWDPLIDAARAASERAYAPYSGFRVGAAIRTGEGQVFVGCNIENRSFGSTVCAERVAIGSAVAAGRSDFEALVVITDNDPPSSPCGLCLQVLTEFGHPNLPILLVNSKGERRQYRLSELHPHPFELPSQGLGKHTQS